MKNKILAVFLCFGMIMSSFAYAYADADSDSQTIDPSIHQKNCEKCEGSGEVSQESTCEKCEGNGNVDCSTCSGTGVIEDEGSCPDCENGEVTCTDCNGEGKTSSKSTCSDCEGSGKVDCKGSFTTEEITKATCLSEGKNKMTCDCGYSYEATVEKTEHNWDDGTVTKEKTCTENGVKTFNCQNEGCTETKTEEIESGHTFIDGSCECGIVENAVCRIGDKQFETLSEAVTNAKSGDTIVVLKSFEIKKSAYIFDKDITITSEAGHVYTITRGDKFDTTSDKARSRYNPAMIEVQTSEKGTSSLLLENIILDDANKHEGTYYEEPNANKNHTNIERVQDSIIESTPITSTSITLGEGASLRNFGGLTAVRICGNCNFTMKKGSSIIGGGVQSRTLTNGKTEKIFSHTILSHGATINLEKGSVISECKTVNIIMAYGNKTVINGEISNNDCLYHILQTGMGSEYILLDNDGVIKNNIVRNSGALYLNTNNDKLDIYGKIINNTVSDRGAAVAMQNNGAGHIVTMYDGALIENNTNASESGGGVLVGRGTFIMNGGEIKNNTVTKEKGYGGGVYVRREGTFIMNGGVISGNKAKIGAGLAYDAETNVGETKPNVILNGGKIIDNIGDDLAVANEKSGTYSNKERYLYVSDEMILGSEKIYYQRYNCYIQSNRETKQGDVTKNGINSLKTATDSVGCLEPIVTLWQSADNNVDFEFSNLSFDSSKPVYLIELTAKENGDALEGCKTKVYKTTVEENVIKAFVRASGENGSIIALAQPKPDTEVEVTEKYFEITYDANGGVLDDGVSVTKTVKEFEGATTKTLKAPTYDGNNFKGWTVDNDELFDSEYEFEVNEDMHFTAIWEKIEYTLTFDANGGKFADGKAVKELKKKHGEDATIISAPETAPEGKVFDYWEGSKYNPGETYSENSDHTFTAVWKDAPAPIVVPTAEYKVTYVVNEDDTYGKPLDSVTPVDDNSYVSGSLVTVKEALTTTQDYAEVNGNKVSGTWTFVNWDKSDFQITENTTITGSWTFTAEEPTEEPVEEPTEEPEPITPDDPVVVPEPSTPDDPAEITEPDVPLIEKPDVDEPTDITEPDIPLTDLPVDIGEEDTPLSDTPKTGDAQNIMLWLLLAFVSVFGLSGYGIIAKKNK